MLPSKKSAKELKIIKINNVLKNKIILKKDIIQRNIRIIKPVYKEDVILEADKCEYLSGDYHKVTILNRLSPNNTSKTIAKCETKSGSVCERTSDELVKLIGQANYDTVFSSLLSVINHELKIRGILSLLTIPAVSRTVECQTDILSTLKRFNTVHCQTDSYVKVEFNKEIEKTKPRRRKRQALTPYVVQDEPAPTVNKIIVKPEDFGNILNDKQESFKAEPHECLPELGKVFDDNSNDSIGNLSVLSVTTTPELLRNPSILLDSIDKHTRNDISLRDSKSPSLYLNGSVNSVGKISTTSYSDSGVNLQVVTSATSPSDQLQIVNKSMINQMMPEQRMKFILQQASYDWKHCLIRDEDGYLPIHVAVLNNDLDLLRRQCIILKIRNETVDIPVNGNCGSLTALKMSLYQDNAETTAMLLSFGADPLVTDEEHRTPFHIAADMVGDHLHALVNHCRRNPRKILHDEELWKPDFENKSDEELLAYLLNYICKLYDNQGYTPLMLASKAGKYTNVRILIEAAPLTVNAQMPNSGNTALYLAVGAACMDSVERCNKTKVADNFRQTIELLLDHGADVNINNFSNSNVNDLVAENTCVELSTLVANKVTAVRCMSNESPDVKDFNNLMLFQEKDGKVNLRSIKNSSKPVIVANELLIAGSSKKPPAGTASTPGKVGKVKKFKLNEPVVIKRILNKRKIEISHVEPIPEVKKANTLK